MMLSGQDQREKIQEIQKHKQLFRSGLIKIKDEIYRFHTNADKTILINGIQTMIAHIER
jgi:hypothetical protein